MTENTTSSKPLAEKLGVKPGMRVRVTGEIGNAIKAAIRAKSGNSLLRTGEFDIVLRMVASTSEADEFLGRIRDEMLTNKSTVWIATWKKGDPRYVKQEDLIPIARAHNLVDNKICSLDDRRSAMRFVVPKELR